MSLRYNGDLIKTARALRKNATPWEKDLWYFFLKDYPIRFQRQKVIDNYIVDFFCSKVKLAIELDGGLHYSEKGKQNDALREERLNALGVNIIRFSNLEIDKNIDGVCTAIDNKVKLLLNEQK